MSSFPKPDVKDEIIKQAARILRKYREKQAMCSSLIFDTSAALNSYGDTLMPEEVLKILTTLPGGE